MRILYDISPQGICEQRGTRLTGIPRVADELFRALVSSEQDVSAVSAFSQAGSVDYYLRAGGKKLGIGRWQACISRALLPPSVLKRFFSRMEDRSAPARFVRGLGVKGDRFVSPLLGRIPGNLLRQSDAYLFPNCYLPRQVRRADILSAVVQHDMIPLMHPEFFTSGQVKDFSDGLATLRPETQVLCNSESTRRDFLQKTGHPAAHAAVFPLGAGAVFHPAEDSGSFDFLSSVGLERKSYFLSVGTLEPRKNMAGLLEAFGAFVAANPESKAKLVLTGALGWRLAEAEETFRKHRHLESRVVRTGFVSDRQLQILYEGAVAYLSLSHYEGFNLPLVEAMKCGIPVIASNVSSHPEVVGTAGCLVHAGDPAGVADAMQALSTRPELVARLSADGVRRAAHYSWTNSASAVVEALHTRLQELS